MENVKKFYDALAKDEAMKKRAEALSEKHRGKQPDESAMRADIIAFAKTEGYDFTLEDYEAYAKQVKPLTDEQLEAVAGGITGFCACYGPGGGGGKTDEGDTFGCACFEYGQGGDAKNENWVCYCGFAGGGAA